jgi:hypothetical protein
MLIEDAPVKHNKFLSFHRPQHTAALIMLTTLNLLLHIHNLATNSKSKPTLTPQALEAISHALLATTHSEEHVVNRLNLSTKQT